MNDYNPLISICVPIYGVEQYIRRCAISLFEQTYSNIEYIFVNDCTPDNSLVVLEGVMKQYPNRKDQVRIINHDHNRGLAAARNTAVNHAHGELIMHVDSDDWIEKDMIEKLVRKQQTDNSDIVCCGYQREYSNHFQAFFTPKVLSPLEMTISSLRRVVSFNIWGKLIRISLYKKNHLKCIEGVNMGEDWQIMPKLYYNSSNIDTVNESLYHYNCINANSYSNNFSICNANQTWESAKDLEVYFNRNVECLEALREAKLKIINDHLLNASRIGDKKDYIDILWKRYDAIKNKDVSFLSFPYRMVFRIRNKFFLTIFSKIAYKIKNVWSTRKGKLLITSLTNWKKVHAAVKS